MRLKAIIIENFRLFQDRIRLDIDDLTAIVGRNDNGKSTILEALSIFFDAGAIKIDAGDPCVRSESSIVRIGCVFSDLPDDVVLDATAETSLADEYMLNADGDLEIHKVFDCSKSRITPKVFAIALHPTATHVDDLLLLKQTDLKARCQTLGVEKVVDMRVNASIRQGIWTSLSQNELGLHISEIPLDKEDAKAIWEQLSKYLPMFALFQADRPSTDADSEVQDPMKLAVAEAIQSVETQLAEIRKVVEEKALDVARRTLDKLQEMDEALANELKPSFSSEPRWEGFKLALLGDEGIPINKRGSGVRRLILLNFFRAEAERKAQEDGRSIVYAIEEPEVSQHPTNQELLIRSLISLSEADRCQVLITTHVPKIAGLIPVNNVRLLHRDVNGVPQASAGSEGVYEQIVDELGVLPDPHVLKDAQGQLQVIVCVEGKHDRTFLYHMSRLLRTGDNTLPDLENDSRITVIPLHGALLKDWVFNNYLRDAGIPEVHIYDRDTDNKYQSDCDMVNSRGDGSYATLTEKLEMESYLHPDAINAVFGTSITFSDIDKYGGNVPRLIVDVLRKDKSNPMRARIRDGSDLSDWESKAKTYLNEDVAARMTLEQIDESDPDGEVRGWLRQVDDLLE